MYDFTEEFLEKEKHESVVTKDKTDIISSHVHLGSVTNIVNKRIDPTLNKIGRIYSSESGHCERKSSMSAITKEVFVSSPSFPFYTNIGKIIEDVIVEGLYNQGVLVFPNLETEASKSVQFDIPDIGLNLGGKLDAIVLTDKLYIVEIKTAGQKLPSNPEVEKPQQFAQAKIYSAILGIDVILAYFGRNVSTEMDGSKLKLKEILYKYDRGASYKFLFSCAISHYCIKNNLLPRVPDTIDNTNVKTACGYCNFTSFCWGDHDKTSYQDLIEPTDEQWSLAKSYAHSIAGKLSNPNAIKERRNKFYDDILKICNTNAKERLKEHLNVT